MSPNPRRRWPSSVVEMSEKDDRPEKTYDYELNKFIGNIYLAIQDRVEIFRSDSGDEFIGCVVERVKQIMGEEELCVIPIFDSNPIDFVYNNLLDFCLEETIDNRKHTSLLFSNETTCSIVLAAVDSINRVAVLVNLPSKHPIPSGITTELKERKCSQCGGTDFWGDMCMECGKVNDRGVIL